MRIVLSIVAISSILSLLGCSGSGASGTSSAPHSTITVLTATPNPVATGAPVSLSATVTSPSSTAVPAGQVSFYDGPTLLTTVALGAGTSNSATAVYTTSSLAVGASHSLSANYAGTSNFSSSISSTVSLVVNAAAPAHTATMLTASPNPAASGALVTLDASVTSAGGTPTGGVTFYDGATSLGSAPLSNGAAQFSTSTLSAGTTHSLTAAYAATSGFAASTSAAVALVVNASFTANASFSFGTPHQTIAGFGGAEAFYATYLDNHPNESQIMKALFDPASGLGITFLRLQNSYYNFNGSNASTFDTDNTKVVTAATAALGSTPTILLSAWTPPASLKSNNSVNGCTGVTNGNCTSGFGTLAKVNGAYNYAGYGQFWLNSLQAYAALGVKADYISIQNEPDFPATYVGCLFNPTEAPASLYGSPQSYASYGLAFDATYQAIHGGSLASVPRMVGPESFSISNAKSLLTQVPANELDAVAHHLYNVSSYGGNPADQVSPMTIFAGDYPTAMKFATEYYQTLGFSNAIDIHNALTVANDNVYIYWGLTWPSQLANGVSTDQAGLLYIDNPFAAQSTWAYPNGWSYNDAYYTVKHYSYFIRPGYVRYDATVSNTDEAISVYRSPDAKTTVIVILNTSAATTDSISLDLSSVNYTSSAVYRSSFSTPITSQNAERWNSLGAYSSKGISLPPQSLTTVVLTN